MKILVVSSYLPYPLFSGGHIRLYNLLKLLAKDHEITLICEKRATQTTNDTLEIEKFCKKVITIDRKKQWTVQNILKTGLSSEPFLITGHTSGDMKDLIAKELKTTQFDLIHAETSYIMQNIPASSLPIVLVEHNIEYLFYQRFVNQSPFFIRPLLVIDVQKLKRVEKSFWEKATHIVTVSEAEKEIIGKKNVSIVPNGVDIKKFAIKNLEKRNERILFIGDFKWVQNRDSVKWIINDIWPLLSAKLSAKLWIVGKNIPDAIKRLSSDTNIIFDENASNDTAKVFQQADVLLSPIRIGAGTQYKILEAMAVGTPVVTTSLGIAGIDARSEKEVLVGDTAEEVAKKTIAILENKDLYTKIALQARQCIEEKYNWDIIVKQLEAVYTLVVK